MNEAMIQMQASKNCNDDNTQVKLEIKQNNIWIKNQKEPMIHEF